MNVFIKCIFIIPKVIIYNNELISKLKLKLKKKIRLLKYVYKYV